MFDIFLTCYICNYVIKPAQVIGENIIYNVTSISINQQPGKTRQAFLLENKYVCSCDSYFRYGLICRHIFDIANSNQDKNLDKFLINKRWQPPHIEDEELQNQIDKFSFDYQEITQAITGQNTNSEESKEKNEEEKEITFTQKKRTIEPQKKKLERKALMRKREMNLKNVSRILSISLLFIKEKPVLRLNLLRQRNQK